MGNHDSGRAMGRAATLALKMRTTQSAIELLDAICEPYRGSDAEFEAEDPNQRGHIHPDYEQYTDPAGPLGKLIIEAFDKENVGTWESAERDDAFYDRWYDGPYDQFRKRFGFC